MNGNESRDFFEGYSDVKLKEELQFARLGNSIFGSVRAFTVGEPRQYAERWTARAIQAELKRRKREREEAA